MKVKTPGKPDEKRLNRLDKLKNKKGKKLVVYLMAGDPDLSTTEKLVYTLDKAGVSVIELGVPFSDPVADGPTIQKAGERALAAGVNLNSVIKLVKKIRGKTDVPIVFMLYFNLIFSYGFKKFISEAKAAGVDGVIIPDLPFDSEEEFYGEAVKNNLHVIYLASPTNRGKSITKIAEKSGGFVYYILEKGVTGSEKKGLKGLETLRKIKRAADIPVFAGFGVSTPKQAKRVCSVADGVIVGSAFIRVIEKAKGRGLLKAAEVFVKKFKRETGNG